jgi:hypothetical protein
MNNGFEKVYDAFAKMIYAIVIADGVIDENEKKIIEDKVEGKEIETYLEKYIANGEEHLIIESYQNLLNACRDFGPSKEYGELIDVLNDIKTVSAVIDEDDAEILDSIISNLKDKLKTV